MLSVYKIRTDFSFQTIETEDRNVVNKYGFNGTPIADRWSPPEFYIPRPTLPEPAFWGCIFGGVFAVRESFLNEHISLNITDSCELLPIAVEGKKEKFYICHVIEVVNCLDHEKSTVDETNHISPIVFRPRRLGRTLFKLPESPTFTYCWSDSESGSEQSLYSEAQACGYRGLRFLEIWSCGEE